MSNNIANEISRRVIVAPVTSSDKVRLSNKIHVLNYSTIEDINKALKMALALA